MKSLALLAVAALMFTCMAATAADGQAIRSEIGAQARATVSISASVRPIFSAAAAGRAVTVSTNASPLLRYSVVVESSRPSVLAGSLLKTAEPGAQVRSQDAYRPIDQHQVVLIVPD